MMLLTKQELEDHMEKNRAILRVRGELPMVDDINEKTIARLNKAKNTSELVYILEEIDPVNYKMVYAYSETFSYLGVICLIKFSMNDTYKKLPLLNISKVADANPDKYYTIINV